jgi:hypothetical protein
VVKVQFNPEADLKEFKGGKAKKLVNMDDNTKQTLKTLQSRANDDDDSEGSEDGQGVLIQAEDEDEAIEDFE